MLSGLPTDNMYKFLFGLGFALLVSTLLWPSYLKWTLETYRLALELDAQTPVLLASPDSVIASGPRAVVDSVPLQKLTIARRAYAYSNETELHDQTLHAAVNDLRSALNYLRWVVYAFPLLGMMLCACGAWHWYHKTQLPADRAASLAGSSPKILEGRIDLSRSLGPELNEMSRLYGPCLWGESSDMPELSRTKELLMKHEAEFGMVMNRKSKEAIDNLILTLKIGIGLEREEDGPWTEAEVLIPEQIRTLRERRFMEGIADLKEALQEQVRQYVTDMVK